jgi:hypothetical protein
VHLAVPQDINCSSFVVELAADEIAEVDPLTVAEGYARIVANGCFVKGEQDVSFLQVACNREGRLDSLEQNAFLAFLHLLRLPQVRALHALELDAQDRVVAVESVVLKDVNKEVLNDVCRDDVADVLSGLFFQRLERNASAAALAVNSRAATVASVDRRVSLDGKELLAAMLVGDNLDAADNAAGDC